MDSIDARIEAYKERFCYVSHSYGIQQAVWRDQDGQERGGHYLRAYDQRFGKERPLPLTDELVERHLRGQTTLAFYSAKRVGGQTLCREGVVECDDKRPVSDPHQPGKVARYEPINGRELMRDAHLRLERAGISSALELSRRGARVRVFAAEPVPARSMQNLLLYAVGAEERARMAEGRGAVEINPKQEILPEGKVGNSVRGPFGLHQKSGERYPFIRPDGSPVATTLGGQLAYILAVPPVDVMREVDRRPWLEEERSGTLDRAPERERQPNRQPDRWQALSSLGQSPIERWKQQHPLEDVLAGYGVEVSRSGVYHCPLPHHGDGDQTPSLSVDVERGLWHCHTIGQGGSALDLVMAAEGLSSAREAVAYLRGRGEISSAVELATAGRGGEDMGGLR